jgi:hypothetical protein
LFVELYSFQRTHQGIEGLVPADRYFSAAPEVRKTLEARVAANALDLARHGTPRKSFYLTGRVGGEGVSLHGEGGRVVLTKEDGTREEVDLRVTGKRAEPEASAEMPTPASESLTRDPLPAPGTSTLDEDLPRLAESLDEEIEDGGGS